MRLALLGFAPVLLGPALLIAQQSTQALDQQKPAPASGARQAEAPAVVSEPADAPVPNQGDAVTRESAKAAERARKDQAKSAARARKQSEKDKKDAEKEAKFLKLQDNEIVAAVFDEHGNPVKLPPCSKKDKVCQQKRKELLKAKKVPLRVQNGTLTVDGWTGKARLNYDVKNFQFLYVSVPNYGTIVASPDHFPNSSELQDALDGETLTITTKDDHAVQLASDVLLAGKQKHSIFYSVDRAYRQPGDYPTVGYGFVNKAPYTWPGALPLTADQKRRLAKAPTLPKGMEAREMMLPCQSVEAGATPKPIKFNGVWVTPPACAYTEPTGTPDAYSTAERPPDGSGAASTSVAEEQSR